MTTCRMCNTPIARRSKHGNDPIYCSPKCRSKWHYENDRERANAYARKWRAANPDRVRAANLRSQYGLSQDAFDALFASQGARCAICASIVPRGTNWHIDHDHDCCPSTKSCGQCVRGILCGTCNRGLGYFRDSHEILASAAAYVERMSIVRGV